MNCDAGTAFLTEGAGVHHFSPGIAPVFVALSRQTETYISLPGLVAHGERPGRENQQPLLLL